MKILSKVTYAFLFLGFLGFLGFEADANFCTDQKDSTKCTKAKCKCKWSFIGGVAIMASVLRLKMKGYAKKRKFKTFLVSGKEESVLLTRLQMLIRLRLLTKLRLLTRLRMKTRLQMLIRLRRSTGLRIMRVAIKFHLLFPCADTNSCCL